MIINKYWETKTKRNYSRKKYNKTYKGKPTKRRIKSSLQEAKKIATVISLAMLFIIASHLATATNSVYINGAVVQTPSGLDAFVEPLLEGGATLQSPPTDTVKPTKEEVKLEIIRQSKLFGLDKNTMLALAFCESGYDHEVKNPNSTATGVFQYTFPTWQETQSFKNGIDRKDYKANIREAMIDISNGESWRWVECRAKLKARGIYF